MTLKADSLSKHLDESFSLTNRVHLAWAAHRTGDLEGARRYIYNLYEKMDTLTQSEALAVAVEIYNDANLTDSAFICCQKLVKNNDNLNKDIGFYYLLSDRFAKRLPADSIR